MGERSPRRIWGLVVALALIVVTVTAGISLRAALAQQAPSSTITLAAALSAEAPAQESAQESAQLDQQVTELRTRVEDLQNLVNVAFVVVGLLLAVGTGVSLVGFYRAESRAAESHALSITGEAAAQGRANEIHSTFLASSKDTLELVNATLQLAKEASERAVKSIEEKATSALKDLDQRAKSLITRVPQEDDHALVVNQKRRAELISLAHEITGFEINQQILPAPIVLTPHCLFVRGMELHLRQQFEDALRYWNQVALRDDSSDELKSLTWYWIGTEQNNLGDFSEAEQSFDRARRTASETRDLELRRIRLESRFFDKEKEAAWTLIRPLEELLEQAEMMGRTQEVEARKTRILTTLGNVRHQAGNDCRRDGRLDEAAAHYKAALGLFSQTDSQNQWALFGKAEALYRLGAYDEAYPLYRGSLRRHAINEYLNKIEPRIRALAREMELICCVRIRDLWGDVTTAYYNVIEVLGQVDERLTVYSQLQRRNVHRPQFRYELGQLMRELHEAGGPAVGGFGEELDDQ